MSTTPNSLFDIKLLKKLALPFIYFNAEGQIIDIDEGIAARVNKENIPVQKLVLKDILLPGQYKKLTNAIKSCDKDSEGVVKVFLKFNTIKATTLKIAKVGIKGCENYLSVLNFEGEIQLTNTVSWQEGVKKINDTKNKESVFFSFRNDAINQAIGIDYLSPCFNEKAGAEIKIKQYTCREIQYKIHPFDRAVAVESFNIAARDNTIWNCEFRFNRPTQSAKWVMCIAIPIADVDQSIQWRGVLLTIGERKRKEQYLIEREAGYRAIMDSMNESVWIIGLDGRLLDVNEHAINVLGYPKAELLAIGLDGIDDSLTHKQIENLIHHLPHDQYQIFETVHKAKNGKRIPVEVISNLILYQGKKVVLSVVRDISKRQEAKQALRDSEQMFSAIFRNSPVAISIINSKSGFTREVNEAWCEVTGYSIKESLGRTNEELKIITSDQRKQLRAHLKKHGVVRGNEMVIKTKMGEAKHVINSAEIIKVDEEDFIVTMMFDISERKLMEEAVKAKTKEYQNLSKEYKSLNKELHTSLDSVKSINDQLFQAKERAEESDRLKSQFLTNMSHEVRTPLNAILGFSKLMENAGLTEVSRKKYLGIIQNSGKRLMHLIDDIIDISKIESNQVAIVKDRVVMHELVHASITMFEKSILLKEKPKLKLRLNYPTEFEAMIVHTDAVRFQQVLDNLITNAIKYTETGVVEVGVLQDKKHKDFIQLYVKDTGVGIPESEYTNVFKRFRQVEEHGYQEGNGLGLSICKGILKHLGGDIWFTSEVNKGSTFFFTIPLATGVQVKSKKVYLKN